MFFNLDLKKSGILPKPTFFFSFKENSGEDCNMPGDEKWQFAGLYVIPVIYRHCKHTVVEVFIVVIQTAMW